MKNNLQNDNELNTIKALASATSTPFKTAFKAALGVAAAQAALAIMFFGTLALVGAGLYLIFN